MNDAGSRAAAAVVTQPPDAPQYSGEVGGGGADDSRCGADLRVADAGSACGALVTAAPH